LNPPDVIYINYYNTTIQHGVHIEQQVLKTWIGCGLQTGCSKLLNMHYFFRVQTGKIEIAKVAKCVK